MDWNLKAPCWDFTEVDKANLPNNIETMDDSSRIGVFRTTQGDFSVDLKLGHVGNSGSESTKVKDAATASVGVSKMVSSSSGTSKRARAINNANLTVSCLVDGCNSDLRNCRDYHRRHKVCELHSKTPEVTIGGLKQRFCQQCSRFHSLDQFDERKRSCRKRLDGHNRRRRKPQPEPLTQPVGSFLSNYQGTQLLPFSSPHVYPSTAIVNNSTWSGGLVNSSSEYSGLQNQQQQQLHMVDNKQDLFLGSSPTSSYKEGNKQLAFLHSDNHQNPPFHSVLRTNSLPVQDSPCALSLLSSSQTHTPGNSNLNQMVQPHHSMPNMQPLGLSLHDNNNTLLESVVPNESDHCSSMYNMGSDDGSQGNEGPQLFPFQWE